MRFNKNKFHPRSYKLKTLSGQPHSKYNVAPVEARTYEGIVFASKVVAEFEKVLVERSTQPKKR